ncbi:MAG: MFS transporter, partial [Gammaproteobacteria bacterium]
MSSLANHAADAVRAEAQGAAAAPASPTSDPKRWYVLGMLTLVYATMHMDRHIVTLLLEPIKLEFALTDTQLGFLAGLSFAIAFSAAGIPLGLLVDRVNRVRLLSVLITLWSGLTFICGFATSYLMLVLARIGIGCAESGGSPTSSSLIGDFFRRKERPVAFGVYHTGTQIGSIIGFAAAGQ